LRTRAGAVVGCLAAAALMMAATVRPADAQGTRGPKEIYVIGAYETAGESPQAIPNLDDGAKLAVTDLQKKGYTVGYERIAASGTVASSQEQAFLVAQAKRPDAWIGLPSSNVFIPVGPKVAATDLPTFALSAPSEGVMNGPSGGNNIFLVPSLAEQTYSEILQFICTDLKKELGLKEMKIALNLVQTSFGSTVENTIENQIGDYKGCSVVSTNTNSAVATDLTQQALAIRDSGANVVMSANLPEPSGVLVNQLRQNGVTLPFVGGANLNLAVDAGSIQNLDGLWATDDCVPELDKTNKVAKKFVKDYLATYGYPPDHASAQVYDAFHIIANTVQDVGHDYATINKQLAGTRYDGVCHYTNDKNNVLARSVTVYKYESPTDKTKVLEKVFPLEFVPNDELGAPTTLPPTTVAAG
jgi:ABC-type branched-subunit amino acid transport system substrate-binding protein